ncbi:Hypothetical protein R9X50_00765300 [Acrodontium crateriforme]|uniref:Uncharacterized protein n=1 Tax=Acrodontium crateriforme TaxID=150365 RepID=A0AAQ3MC46_9PEZI|nr:Hypothetical protein R9X50_00765300 [Acrodontium crateriforme]
MAVVKAWYTLLFSFVCLSTSQTLDANSCVAPSAYTQCMSEVTDSATSCFQKNCDSSSSLCESVDNCYSADANCATACTCSAYQGWINCAVANCWNMAHSCEYQEIVVNAVRGCGFALAINFPPYFPPKDDAPGRCSCAIGDVYYNMYESLDLDNHCQTYINEELNAGAITGTAGSWTNECGCCAASHAVSALPDLCPDTDPTSIGYWSKISLYDNNVQVLQRTVCENLFSQNLDCTASPLNYSLPNSNTFYGAQNLPAFGTESISNVGSMTTPAAATIVWSLVNGFPAATAIAAGGSLDSGGSGSSSASSGAVSSNASPSTTSSATSTGGSSNSSSSSSSGGAGTVPLPGFMLVVAATLALTVAWL